MSEAYITLIAIMLLGGLVKNIPVVAGAGVLLVLKLFNLKSIIVYFDNKGIQLGLIILFVALLAPIALGEYRIADITQFIREPLAILALIMGLAVTLFAKQGIALMADSPLVVPLAILGIITGVVFFKGVPTGPLIASGLTAAIYGLIQFITGG